MGLKQDIDYGTPEVTETETVTLSIDGQDITVPKGTSIMRAAQMVGTTIPKLCATWKPGSRIHIEASQQRQCQRDGLVSTRRWRRCCEALPALAWSSRPKPCHR